MKNLFTTGTFQKTSKGKFNLSLTDKNKETNKKIFELVVSADWFLIKQFFVNEGNFMAEQIKDEEDLSHKIFYKGLNDVDDTINVSAMEIFNNPQDFHGLKTISFTDYSEENEEEIETEEENN